MKTLLTTLLINLSLVAISQEDCFDNIRNVEYKSTFNEAVENSNEYDYALKHGEVFDSKVENIIIKFSNDTVFVIKSNGTKLLKTIDAAYLGKKCINKDVTKILIATIPIDATSEHESLYTYFYFEKEQIAPGQYEYIITRFTIADDKSLVGLSMTGITKH